MVKRKGGLGVRCLSLLNRALYCKWCWQYASERDFIWSEVGEDKRDHLVSWDVVCNSKTKGGLGFGKISLRNLAFLGKWLWRYPREG